MTPSELVVPRGAVSFVSDTPGATLIYTTDGSDPRDALKRLVNGDREALACFVRRWERTMFRIAYRVVGHAADAEEIRQIVLLRLIQHPDRMLRVHKVDVWLRRCVINEAISWLRRKKQGRLVDLHDGQAMVNETNETADEELATQLQAALKTLEPQERALLALRFDEGLSFREIASVLESPHTTVHAQYRAAIRALRAKLTPDFARLENGR